MKNATQVRLVMLLGVALWVAAPAVTHAQTDETPEDAEEGDADAAEGDEGDATEDAGDTETEDAETGDAETGDAAGSGEAAEAGDPDDAGEPAEAGETEGGDDFEIDDGHDEIADPEGLPPVDTTELPAVSEPTEAATTGLTEPETEAPPAEEAPAEEAEEEAPAGPEPLPWRNTFFTWTNQVSFNSFVRGSQLSYNPNYSQNFSLTPRWYVAPMSFFWFSQSLGLELTDTDGNALNRDPQLTDTLIDFRHMIPWEGFVFIPAVRIGIPVSKISQAAQRYLQTGLTLTAVRPISEAGLTIAGIFSYRRWWAGSNVVQVGEPQPDSCPAGLSPIQADGDSAPVINTATCDQLGTASSARDVLLYGLATTFAPPGFSEFQISLQVFFFTTYGHELAPAYIDVETRDTPLRIDDGSPSHWNNFTYIALSVGYQFLPWLNVSLGIQNSGVVASAYNPDGSIRNPIFTPDTQVFLSATFQVDAIYSEIAGGEEDLTPEERLRRRQGLASGPSAGGTF